MGRRLDTIQPATDVDRSGPVPQMEYAGMSIVVGAEHLLRLMRLIRPPDIADLQHRQQHALSIAQRHPTAASDLAGERLRYVQGDRYRPQGSIAQPQLRDHPVIVGLIQKTVQRREPAIQ